MLIPENVERNIIRAVHEVLGWERTHGIEDITGLILNYNIAKEVIEREDEIVELIPKTQKRLVRKFISYMRENLDNIARTIATGSNDLNMLLWNFMVSKISEVIFDEKKAGEKLAEIIPIEVRYRAGSKWQSGYVLAPTPKEKEKIEEYNRFHVEQVLTSLARSLAKLDFEKKTVTIYGMTMPLTERGIVELAHAIERWSDALKYLRGRVKETLEKNWYPYRELVKSVADIYDGIRLELNTDELESRVKSLAEGVEEEAFKLKRASIEIHLNSDLTFSVSISLSGENVAYYTHKYSKRSFRDELVDTVSDVLRDAENYVVKYAPVVLHARKLASMYKYEIQVPDSAYYSVFSVKLGKHVGKADVGVTMYLPEDPNEASVYLHVTIDKGMRKIPVGTVTDYLISKGIKHGKVEVYGRRITYSDKYSLEELEEALVDGENVAKALTEFLSEYERKLKVIKVATQMDTETYVALYLAKDVAHTDINIEQLIGRPEGVVYSTVARVLKSLDPKIIEELKREAEYWGDRSYIKKGYRVVRYLFEHGYVTADAEGRVLVNGKHIVELLEKANIPAPIGERVEASLLSEYLSYLFMHREGKSEADILREKGYVTPKFITNLILINRLPSLDLLLDKYQGKRIWDYLDDSTRFMLLYRMSYYQLEEVLDNKELAELFKPYKDMIISKASETNERLLLKAVLTYAPDAIGVKGDVRVYKEEDIVALDMGEYLVTPYRMTEAKRDADKWFLVFRKQNKIGIMVKAKTVDEAVSQAPLALADVLRELKEIKNSWYKDRLKIVKTNYGGSSYQVIELILPASFRPSIPHESSVLNTRVIATPGLKQELDKFYEDILKEEEYEKAST